MTRILTVIDVYKTEKKKNGIVEVYSLKFLCLFVLHVGRAIRKKK